MALAAPADLQLAGKSTHPIKGSLGLLLSIADARLSRGARPRQGEGCRAVGADEREWGHTEGKKGGSGQVPAARAAHLWWGDVVGDPIPCAWVPPAL